MFSQIDFCLPENQVVLILSVGAYKISISVSFGGRAPFKQYSQRIGRWGARDAGGLTLADPQAVSPTSGCSRTCCGTRAPAPPGASESSAGFLVSLIHFSCFS